MSDAYDGFARLRGSSGNMGRVTRAVSSDFDAHGNRTRVTHLDGAFFDCEYDTADRLFHSNADIKRYQELRAIQPR